MSKISIPRNPTLDYKSVIKTMPFYPLPPQSLRRGGFVKAKGKRSVAVIIKAHSGELVIPVKYVEKIKRYIKKEKMKIPLK